MRYRTIVADPPWDHSDGTGTSLIDGRWVQSAGVPYDCMSIEAICALRVGDLADKDAQWSRYHRGHISSFSVAAPEWAGTPGATKPSTTSTSKPCEPPHPVFSTVAGGQPPRNGC